MPAATDFVPDVPASSDSPQLCTAASTTRTERPLKGFGVHMPSRDHVTG